jgi:hypothetical protein
MQALRADDKDLAAYLQSLFFAAEASLVPSDIVKLTKNVLCSLTTRDRTRKG